MKKSLRNHRIFFHRMGLLFLFIPLVVLIISIVLPDKGFSEKENRVLSSRPHLNGSQIASGGFEKQFETYENDQFPLRDLWITLKAGTDRLMGKRKRMVYIWENPDILWKSSKHLNRHSMILL